MTNPKLTRYAAAKNYKLLSGITADQGRSVKIETDMYVVFNVGTSRKRRRGRIWTCPAVNVLKGELVLTMYVHTGFF